MVKRYGFVDLVFGKEPIQAIITLLNGSSKFGIVLEEVQESFDLISTQIYKLLPQFEAFHVFETIKSLWLFCYKFY